ncbi:COP23 domain-containing protein [Phormidesmis priestleyi]
MSRRQFGSSLKIGTLAVKSVSLSMGATLLLSGLATAAPALQGIKLAQTTSPSGDVIINTEPGTSSGSTTAPSVISGVRFACQTMNGQPTVMYQPESQPSQAFPWAVPSTLGGGWDSARRCSEISRRLEAYRPDGLVEMKTGVENGYNTICVTTDRVPSCRIVLTVPPGQDPVSTRDRVFQNLTVADSGQQTQGVVTFGETSNGILGQIGQVLGIGRRNTTRPSVRSGDINLKPFLDRRDGGTGERLSGGVTVRQTPRANNRLRLRIR